MLGRCVDNTNGYEKVLTLGKIYKVEKSDIHGYLNIKTNNGMIKYVYVSRFEPYSFYWGEIMINDCDYCASEYTYLEEYESSDGTTRKLDIIFIPAIRNIIVKIIDNTGLEINFGIDKRINYCPYCGRKINLNHQNVR